WGWPGDDSGITQAARDETVALDQVSAVNIERDQHLAPAQSLPSWRYSFPGSEPTSRLVQPTPNCPDGAGTAGPPVQSSLDCGARAARRVSRVATTDSRSSSSRMASASSAVSGQASGSAR